jgi:hypothetical protein
MNNADEFLKSLGYVKPDYVTQSRKTTIELMEKFAVQECKKAFKSGFNSAIIKAGIEAKVTINYMPNDTVGEMPEIASCQVDRDSIFNLKML